MSDDCEVFEMMNQDLHDARQEIERLKVKLALANLVIDHQNRDNQDLGETLAATRAKDARLRELAREVLDSDKGTIDPPTVREIEDILDAAGQETKASLSPLASEMVEGPEEFLGELKSGKPILLEAVKAAAHAIWDRHKNILAYSGCFITSAGCGDGKVVIFCRREPRRLERKECIKLAGDVPVEFIVSGKLAMASGTQETR